MSRRTCLHNRRVCLHLTAFNKGKFHSDILLDYKVVQSIYSQNVNMINGCIDPSSGVINLSSDNLSPAAGLDVTNPESSFVCFV